MLTQSQSAWLAFAVVALLRISRMCHESTTYNHLLTKKGLAFVSTPSAAVAQRHKYWSCLSASRKPKILSVLLKPLFGTNGSLLSKFCDLIQFLDYCSPCSCVNLPLSSGMLRHAFFECYKLCFTYTFSDVSHMCDDTLSVSGTLLSLVIFSCVIIDTAYRCRALGYRGS